MFETFKAKVQMSKLMVNTMFSKFEQDTRGETPIKSLLMLLIVAVLAGALVPVAINAITAGKNASWTTSEIALYGVLSIMILVGVVLLIVRVATD
jgi:hypothetical protein